MSSKIRKNGPFPRTERGSRIHTAPRIDPRYARFKLRIGRSPIHRFGVFAAEAIPPRRKVIEYTGERISWRAARKLFAAIGFAKANKQTYLFEFNRYWVINGAVGGCGAEFINHSCEPNLRQQTFKDHILLMSGRRIRRGEELTYDYRFDKSAGRQPCACGSPKCRGTINLERKEDWLYSAKRRRG